MVSHGAVASSSPSASTAAAAQLKDFKLGFSSNDALVDQISLVIRMLYLTDYRELQNDLNALIVLGQEYTANPKTNTALGKTGY